MHLLIILRNFGVCFKAIALDPNTQMETIFMHKIKHKEVIYDNLKLTLQTWGRIG